MESAKEHVGEFLVVSYVLRGINKAKWYKEPHPTWLPQGELQADVLGDLRTKDNSLSVWDVDDGRANFDRIVAALVVKKTSLAEFDYALIKIDFVEELNIKTVPSPGDTFDNAVNTWHRDFVELTALKLYSLAVAIKNNAEKIDRIYPKDVKALVKRSFELNYLDNSKIDPKMLAEIERL